MKNMSQHFSIFFLAESQLFSPQKSPGFGSPYDTEAEAQVLHSLWATSGFTADAMSLTVPELSKLRWGSGGLLLMKGTASSGGLLLDLGLNNASAYDLIHVGMLDSGFKVWFMWVDDESWTNTGSVMMNIGCWMGYPAAISSMACWKIHHLKFSSLIFSAKDLHFIRFSSLPCLIPAGYFSGLCNNTNHDHC